MVDNVGSIHLRQRARMIGVASMNMNLKYKSFGSIHAQRNLAHAKGIVYYLYTEGPAGMDRPRRCLFTKYGWQR